MGDVLEHAVDAETNAQIVLLRLDVDVGRAVPQALSDQHVDDLDRGRGGGDARELDDGLARGGELWPALLQRPRDLVDPRPHAVDPAEVGKDVRPRGEIRGDRQAGDAAGHRVVAVAEGRPVELLERVDAVQ